MESQQKLDTKDWVSFSGWQYFMCVVTHCLEELTLFMKPLGEDKHKLSIKKPPGLYLMHLFCWLILICLLLLK